jgi:hypothetical protein
LKAVAISRPTENVQTPFATAVRFARCRGDEEKEPLIRKTGAPEFDATLEPGRTPDKGR